MLDNLITLYQSKQIYGSWIFSGKKGVGKYKCTYDLAKFILEAEYGKSVLSVIDTHPALKILKKDITDKEKKELNKAFEKGEAISSEQIGEMELNKSINISQVRELIDGFSISLSGENKSKIVIIDSINDLNKNSANCLLKFLEEPSKNTIVILICHNLGSVLPTIKSRCRKIAFKPLSDDEITPILKAEYPYLSNDDLKNVLFYADGSVGSAFSFLENNGLDVVASFRHVIDNFPNIPYQVAEKTASQVAKDEIKAEILTNTILLTLNKRAKENNDENYALYFSKALQMFKNTKLPLSLDLRQTIISVLMGNV